MTKYPPLSEENYALEVTTFLKVYELTLRTREVAESLECSLSTFNRLISGISKPTEKAIKETEKMMKLTEISNFDDYSKIPASQRQKVVEKINSDGPKVAVGAAATMANDADSICVIGGGEIYRQAYARADRLLITHVEGNVEGDTFFPVIDPMLFDATTSEIVPQGEKDSHASRYVVYQKRKG